MTVALVLALTLFYAVIDLYRAPNAWQAISYALELAVPLVALLLARSILARHIEALTLYADICFTALIAFRVLLPSTTVSGTALFLSLKLLSTAVLWPWHPLTQYISTAATMLLYYLALSASGRLVERPHEMVGPLIAAVLSCVGAAIADRTRRDLWQRSLALSESESRARSLLEAERLLGAIAREISVLTDLRGTLDRINVLTAAALGCDYSMTYLVDRAQGAVIPAATNCDDPPMREVIMTRRSPLDTPLVRELLAGRSVVINDPATQTWLAAEEMVGVRSVALTPISAKGQVVGVLTVTRTTNAAPIDDRQVALLKAIAAQAAIAIENARLFETLAKSEASYRDLFERATDLIFVIEEDGALRFANQAALDFVGMPAEALCSKRWQDFVSPDSRALVERRLRLARRRRAGAERAFAVEVCPEGRPSAVLELRTRCISPPGQPRAFQCVARDVTDRRRQERETQQLLTQLREANRLQGEFVANMSHELRTPLNVIIGYADLLGDEPGLQADSDARLFLQRIASAGRALHRLVESVLEYARLDRGRSVLIPRRFPASELLRELHELGEDVRGSSEITVRVQAQADLHFCTDYDRLYSVLSNLLLNAIKFTAAGSVELAVRRVGLQAEFTVRDTGIGIDAEELAHVFEPFRQVDGSPTRTYGGVGLGLAIVRRNAGLLGGTVEVESQLGVGSCFRVRLPLELNEDAAERAA
ncbi:MAG: ATP-binding protein [Deltaproteobacteria bacterium]|nr:ATP-binding protein [Deltaproteobacteria bacterium]